MQNSCFQTTLRILNDKKYTKSIIYLILLFWKGFISLLSDLIIILLSFIITLIWLYKIWIPAKVSFSKVINVTYIYVGDRSKIINLVLFIDFLLSPIKDNCVIQFLIAAHDTLMDHKINHMSHNQNFWTGEKRGKWNRMEYNKMDMLKFTALFSYNFYLLHIVVRKVWKPLLKSQIWFSLTSFLSRKKSFLNCMMKGRKLNHLKR